MTTSRWRYLVVHLSRDIDDPRGDSVDLFRFPSRANAEAFAHDLKARYVDGLELDYPDRISVIDRLDDDDWADPEWMRRMWAAHDARRTRPTA
jgi:hypothetical protein